MKPIVFLGPSLLHADAATILDSEIRAPAAAGDVLAATLKRPPAIVLVDGLFERVPAVWHKEILFAIESGVPVYGASSMGALRATDATTAAFARPGTAIPLALVLDERQAVNQTSGGRPVSPS